MKLFLFFLALTTLSLFAKGAEPVEVTSGIREVTVFLQGAQISRDGRINLPKGPSSLAFRDLPMNMDPQSIQAGGEGNFVILSVVHQVNYLAGQKKTVRVKQLQDSVKFYEEKLAQVNNSLHILKSEEEMLNINRSVGSTEKGLVLSELKLAVEYYRTRLTDIKKDQLRYNRESIQLNERIDKLNNQLDILNAGLNQPSSEVIVQVLCNENLVNGKIRLRYTVYDAGWTPVYDVRAQDVQNPVRLVYNANVYQNTGEAWEKVNMKLSTANPQQRGEKPNLQPWFIDFEQPLRYLMQYNTINAPMAKESKAEIADEAIEPEGQPGAAATVSAYTEVNENQTNMEFSIRIPYDIPSDNQRYLINIQDYTLPAVYEYYCAPKLDREAFLVARITGWENYNLLSGEMNLFFEDTYVGKSYLSIRNTNDTLDISLGRDKGIIVTRVKMKDFTEVKTIGSNKRETRAWEITVRNNKKQPVQLHLEDQLPVSMNKDIEIEALEYSGGKYNRETGIISWRQRFEPASEGKLRISFAVKYPKDKMIYID